MCTRRYLQSGNLHQVWEDNHVLELSSQPNQVQGILVDGHLVCQSRSIVTAEPGAAVGVDANAEVADSGLQVGVSGNVGNGSVDVVVDLGRVGGGLVTLVVKGEKEDGRDEGRGGRATGQQ